MSDESQMRAAGAPGRPAGAGARTAGADGTAEVRRLLDGEAVREAVTRVAVLADRRDWAALRTVFADEVDVNYTALTGGAPARLAADALLTGWRATLPGFDATQHLVANTLVAVEGDRATCTADVQARHFLAGAAGGGSWTLFGRYRYGLTRTAGGWRVHATTLTVVGQEGNEDLLAEARRRVGAPGPMHSPGQAQGQEPEEDR